MQLLTNYHEKEPGDRNYHIFYYLMAGADDELRNKLALGSPTGQFNYLGEPIDPKNMPLFKKVC